MNRLTLVLITSVLLASSALAQSVETKTGPIPVNPNTSNSTSTDENGVNSLAAPGATSTGAVRDSTSTGDNGAYARRPNSSNSPELDNPEAKSETSVTIHER